MVIFLGILDNFRKKPEENPAEEKTQQAPQDSGEGRFNQVCALCGKGPTDVKWMGQYFHKKCKRQARKLAGKMI